MTDTEMLTREERREIEKLLRAFLPPNIQSEHDALTAILFSHDAADAEIDRLRGRVKELEKQRPSYRIVKLEDEETPPEEKQ